MESTAEYRAIQLSSMRKVIARRLTESKQNIPHFYVTAEVRTDRLESVRQELNAASSNMGIKFTVTDLLLKAVGSALQHIPDANVQIAGDVLRQYTQADVSLAVSITGGLMTPVIHDVARLSLTAIATKSRDVIARARCGKIAESELMGGTATLSNLGMYGAHQFTAILNPPQSTIFAIGATQRRPLAINDTIIVGGAMTVTGSFDHRAIDGSTAAQLMDAFRVGIEHPALLLA